MKYATIILACVVSLAPWASIIAFAILAKQ